MNILDQDIFYKLIDDGGIRDDIARFPEMIEEIITTADTLRTEKLNVKNVIYAGMGGSGISGDMLQGYISTKLKVPFVVVKGYALPEFAGDKTLVICVTYSGKTRETLNLLNEARIKGCKLAIISSEDVKHSENELFMGVPSGLQPRVATGYLLFSTLFLLRNVGLLKVKHAELKAVVALLRRMRDNELGITVQQETNLAKQIANHLKGKIPVIHATEGTTSSVALRWKQQINEMAKNLAFSNTYPEFNHNEIVSYQFPGNIADDVVVISLQSEFDNPEAKRARDIVEREMLGYDVDQVIQVKAWGNGELEQLLSLVYIGDYMAFYLSILNQINPGDVTKINVLKNRLDTEK